jgi:hypothetical protein
MAITPRVRTHEDRGGDPLDGLVNLFDLGIVLSVAFLLAALSSLDLTEVLTDRPTAERQATSADSVTAGRDEVVREIELKPGERVVGNGEPIGRVYQLSDGRTVIVREREPGEAKPEP